MRRFLLLIVLLSLAFAPAPFPRPQKPLPNVLRVAFRMEKKKWTAVFAWLTEQTGLPIITSSLSGSFTFIGPKGRKYTIPEAVAIINRDLRATHGLILIQTDRSFQLVRVDDQ
jgi:hypothetical protein